MAVLEHFIADILISHNTPMRLELFSPIKDEQNVDQRNSKQCSGCLRAGSHTGP